MRRSVSVGVILLAAIQLGFARPATEQTPVPQRPDALVPSFEAAMISA